MPINNLRQACFTVFTPLKIVRIAAITQMIVNPEIGRLIDQDDHSTRFGVRAVDLPLRASSFGQ